MRMKTIIIIFIFCIITAQGKLYSEEKKLISILAPSIGQSKENVIKLLKQELKINKEIKYSTAWIANVEMAFLEIDKHNITIYFDNKVDRCFRINIELGIIDSEIYDSIIKLLIKKYGPASSDNTDLIWTFNDKKNDIRLRWTEHGSDIFINDIEKCKKHNLN